VLCMFDNSISSIITAQCNGRTHMNALWLPVYGIVVAHFAQVTCRFSRSASVMRIEACSTQKGAFQCGSFINALSGTGLSMA
jgi:hypothetical protein